MEITSPGGDLEKLKYAIDYGADSVYAGFKDFGLRAASGNLSRSEILEGIRYAHQHDAKLFLTLNAYLKNQDFGELRDFIQWLAPTGIDAVIVSDPGVFAMVKRHSELPVHISTQANVCNLESARFWQEQGAKRIVLAREMAFSEIIEIREALPDLELEIFIHGAMCIAYSGRCLLSAYINNRSANLGACTQPCRWDWALTEASRPGEYFAVEEDKYGSYILSSKDISLLSRMPELLDAGITAGKIEGRMKSLYYVAQTTRLYRTARELSASDSGTWELLKQELNKVSHRPYWEGMYFAEAEEQGISQDTRSYSSETEYCGKIIAY